MLLLRKHLLPLLLRPVSPLHHRSLLLATSVAPFSLDDYLVVSCGLSPDQARKASKKALTEASREAGRPLRDLSCSRLNSASNPDAVLALLSGVGLARADIAAIVNAYPLILRCKVSIIGPRLLALRDRLGLSATQIACFLLVGCPAFCSRDVAPNFEFFISFYGSFRGLLAAVKRNNSILVADLERVIKPNIEQFLQCGLSVRDIVHVCSVNPRVLLYNPERLKEFVLRADELGVPRSSPMFKYAVAAVTYIGKEKVAAKLEVLKGTLGCSDTEVATAVSRMPSLLGISEEHFRHKIQFLVNRVGMEPRYIVERPVLLGFSLEKRLVPRYCVMKVLHEEGLLNGSMSFFTLAAMKEETFKLRFVDSHKEAVPALSDIYAAACSGHVSPELQL